MASDKLGYASPAELKAQEQRQWRRVTPGAGDVREEGDVAGGSTVRRHVVRVALGIALVAQGGCVRACVQCKSRDGDGCTNRTRCVRDAHVRRGPGAKARMHAPPPARLGN